MPWKKNALEIIALVVELLQICGFDALVREKQEVETLTESLDQTCTRYHMEVSAEMTILMTYNSNDAERKIKEERQIL